MITEEWLFIWNQCDIIEPFHYSLVLKTIFCFISWTKIVINLYFLPETRDTISKVHHGNM